MTVLIVDDERHVIDALLLLIPWEEMGIHRTLTACSVPEAIRLLDEERPDVAFVDVVIGDMLGTEILNHINRENLSTKAIAISGHDDYQYIRAMFILGGVDYLLKPIEQQVAIQALQKAIRLVERAEAGHGASSGEEQNLKQIFPDYQRGLFQKLLHEETRTGAFEELCRINERVRAAKSCTILYGDGFFLPVHEGKYLLSLSKLLNDLLAELEDTNCGTLFQRNQPYLDIVILLYAQEEKSTLRIGEQCTRFNRANGVAVRFGRSLPHPFPDGIGSAWKQAITASYSVDREDAHGIVPYTQDMFVKQVPADKRLENQLFSPLLIEDKPALESALNEWLLFVSAEIDHTSAGIKNIWVYFCSLCEQYGRYHADYDGERASAAFRRPDILSVIYKKSWEDALSVLRPVLLEHLWEMRNMSDRNHIGDGMQRIADYLELNFNQKIQQQKCADFFHLNKDYISRRFKETYGVGMVVYLNRIRIRRAKELLVESNLQIQEIADEVGFFDTKYFAKQFRRETGQSPAAYRAQHRPVR